MPGQGRLGDKANISSDAHGCPGCPHPGTGPGIQGSPNVMVNGRPALRVDDVGMHAACCGPNMWTAQSGAAHVFINGKAAFRLDDPSRHCGGSGKLIEGSADVVVGDGGGGGAGCCASSAAANDPASGAKDGADEPSGALHQLLVEDAHFNTDSAVLLPDFDEEVGPGHRTTGLALLRAALLHLDSPAGKGQQALVAGHTDTVGAAGYNLVLSQRRADNVRAALKGQRDDWAQSANLQHVGKDIQQILKFVANTDGYDCDPGKHDLATATVNFKKAYNRDYNGKLTLTSFVDVPTWGAFFDIYMDVLADILAVDENTLATKQRAIAFVDDKRRSVGCGLNFPIERPDELNVDSATNRRVEMLFFRPNDLPKLDCHPSAGACSPEACEINRGKKNGDKGKKFTRIDVPATPIPTGPPQSIAVTIDEVAGLYQPAAQASQREAATAADPTLKHTRDPATNTSYKSADHLGRVFIDQLPDRDLVAGSKRTWAERSAKRTQFIDVRVSIATAPTASRLPADTEVEWSWSDAHSPPSNSGDCFFPDKNNANSNGATFEPLGKFAMTSQSASACRTEIHGRESMVRLHLTDVAGDAFRLSVRAVTNASVPSFVVASTGDMTMWRRIDVEYKKQPSALDLTSVSGRDLLEETAVAMTASFWQLDFAAVQTIANDDAGIIDEKLLVSDPNGEGAPLRGLLDAKLLKANFTHFQTPPWFLLLAARMPVNPTVNSQRDRQILYHGVATLVDVAGGKTPEQALEITAPNPDNLAALPVMTAAFLEEGRRVVPFGTPKNPVSVIGTNPKKYRIKLSPKSYEPDFLMRPFSNTTRNYFPGVRSAPKNPTVNGKTYQDDDGCGFKAGTQVRVKLLGARAFAALGFTAEGRISIYTQVPGVSMPPRPWSRVLLDGTWAAGDQAQVSFDGGAVSYTVRAGDIDPDPALTRINVADHAADAINADPTARTKVRAYSLGDSIQLEPRATSAVTVTAAATSAGGQLTLDDGKGTVAASLTLPVVAPSANELLSTLVHEMVHAIRSQHGCGQVAVGSTAACAGALLGDWLYVPPANVQLDRFNEGVEGTSHCEMHRRNFREARLATFDTMWKFTR
jgi:outer membrane protein OmpA-like peptidoglycan-associated protein/uncharacterized Zn-binding protein involved in type VI secretion